MAGVVALVDGSTFAVNEDEGAVNDLDDDIDDGPPPVQGPETCLDDWSITAWTIAFDGLYLAIMSG